MITRINHTDPVEAQEILRVQVPAYQVEAEQIEFFDIPGLHDTVERIQASCEIFYGYYVDGSLAGFISYETNTPQDQKLVICRLVVDPKYFRRGIAQALLDFVQEKGIEVEAFIVGTGKRNIPAVTLYQKNGFNLIEERTIADHLEYVVLQKKRDK